MQYIKFPIDGVSTNGNENTRTYKLDIANGRIVGMVDGEEAVRIAIEKALRTPRLKHTMVYNGQYGSDLSTLVAQFDATPEYFETEFKKLCEEALLCDSRIKKVHNFAFSYDNSDGVYISFTVDTIYGSLQYEGVV